MPLTDAYEWAKSNMPQDIMKNQPFSDYQYNYVNDINSGIYTNQSLSLVQFDLSSLYNSSRWTMTNSHFAVIPIVRCAEAFDDAVKVPLNNNNYYLTALKNLNTCLVHQVDLLINGKTIHQLQPYTNIFTGIKLASELSKDDLKLMGATLGMLDMDNPNSMVYQNTPDANKSTPGISNNYVKGKPYVDVPDASTPQNSGSANGAIQQKLSLNKCIAGSFNGLQNIVGVNGMNQEFQPTFEVDANGVAIWKDYIVIFMKDLLDAMNHIGCVRRLDGILRIYINTGFCTVRYPAANQLTFSNNESTFTDTCPLLVNNIGALPVAAAGPVTIDTLNVGCFISRAPNATFNGSNWSGVASSMNACRYYYNQIIIQPALALDYISSNSAKTILYDGLLYNTFTNIPKDGNFSQLIQSGVTNIKTVMIVPLVSTVNEVNAVGPVLQGFSAYKSPFDPVGGCAGHPISLQNFQVAVGGTNQLSTSLMYTYENFIEQWSKFSKQSSSEYGVESGLWSPEYWANNRVYLVNCRGTEDDFNTPRNIVISFRNNSLVPVDILVFVQYEDKCVINVSTGIITK